MKRPALFRRTSPFGLPWAGLVTDLLARFSHRSDAAPVPLTYFAPTRQNQPGATLIKRLHHTQQNWLTPIIQMHLYGIWPGVTGHKRAPAVFLPEPRQVIRLPDSAQPLPRRQLHLHHNFRQRDRSAGSVTTIDLAWREPFNRAPQPPGQLIGMTSANTPFRRSPRAMTHISRPRMALAEALRTPPRGHTRTSNPPPVTTRMEFRRPDRAIAALPEPPRAGGTSAWHQAPGGTARAAEPVVPPIGVEQLAGQVLKEIDRRIVARRERLGQR